MLIIKRRDGESVTLVDHDGQTVGEIEIARFRNRTSLRITGDASRVKVVRSERFERGQPATEQEPEKESA